MRHGGHTEMVLEVPGCRRPAAITTQAAAGSMNSGRWWSAAGRSSMVFEASSAQVVIELATGGGKLAGVEQVLGYIAQLGVGVL